MNVKTTWKALGTVVLIFFGGLAVIFASFFIGGFPFPGFPIPNLVWIELLLLLILLGVPLFR